MAGVVLTSPSFEQNDGFVSDDKGEIIVPTEFFDKGPLQATLRFVGMDNESVLLKNGQSVSIQLRPSSTLLKEAVVTGEYGPTHVENAVHRVDLITADDIAATAADDISDVLRHSSEIVIQQDGVLGTGVSIQGLSDRHVKITIDEVPMVGRVDGKLDLTQIDVQDIERIEIVRGPMAASYGSDAIAGVINIITKKPQQNAKALNLRAYASSEGQYDLTGRFGAGRQHYRYAIRAGRRFFDGWSPEDDAFRDIVPIADDRRSRRWNQKEQYLTGLDHAWSKNGRTLSHRLSFTHDVLKDRGLPVINDASETIIGIDDEYRSLRLDNQLKYEQDVLLGGKFSGFVAHNRFSRDRRQDVTDLTDLSQRMLSQDTTIYDAFTTRHTWSQSLSDRFEHQVGIDGSYESSTGERIDGRPYIAQFAGFYSLESQPIDGLVLRPALRWGVHSRFNLPAVPSFSARYRKGVHTLRASYGRGFRAPDFKELYLAFFDVNHNVYGNPDLGAERSQSVNAGYTLNATVDQVKWTAGINLFYNEVDDLITEVQDGIFDGSGVAPFTYKNIDRVLTQGIRFDVGRTTEFLDLKLGAGVIGVERTDAGVFLTPLNYSSQANSSLSYKWAKPAVHLNLLYTYNGEQSALLLRGDVTESTTREAYHMLDFTASKRLFQDRLHLRTGVRNMLDVTDLATTGSGGIHGAGSNVSSPVSTGRTFFFTVEYQPTKSKRK